MMKTENNESIERKRLIAEYSQVKKWLTDYSWINNYTETYKFKSSQGNFQSSYGDIYTHRKGRIEIINADCISAVFKNHPYEENKICLLNMASAKKPGGGVENGAQAQEEYLFRHTNLSATLNSEFYPLEENEILYTQKARIIRESSKYPQLLAEFPFIDVITVAALKNPNPDEKFIWDTIYFKMQMMLRIPALFECNVLILSAWGCGAYKNDPNMISYFFNYLLNTKNYRYLYDKVVFAIINDHNSVGDNFKIFQKNIRRK